MDAGKHVYIEKAMAFTVDQAKLMRAAYQKAGTRVVQIGHQACSLGHVADASNYLASGAVGQVTAIRAHMYRNTPHGKPQWTRPLYPDMTPETIAWNAFLGSAPLRPFDADRYLNWRLFYDYSGGNVHESMSQQLAFWYKVMDLDIPHAVTMTGGIYRWLDGREVPDTMSVGMVHAPGLLVLVGFRLRQQPPRRHGRCARHGWHHIPKGQQIRYFPQKVTRPDGVEMLGQTPTPPRAHMQNFLDCIRTGKQTNCPFEIGLPGLDRLQHGDRELLRRTHHPVGSGEGRTRLNAHRRASAGSHCCRRRHGVGGARAFLRCIRALGLAWRSRPQSDRADVRRRAQPGHPADPRHPCRLRRVRDFLPMWRERSARARTEPRSPRIGTRNRQSFPYAPEFRVRASVVYRG